MFEGHITSNPDDDLGGGLGVTRHTMGGGQSERKSRLGRGESEDDSTGVGT